MRLLCITLVTLVLLLRGNVSAQEVNLGIRVSPILGMPFLDKSSVYHPALGVRKPNFNAGAGADLNIMMGKLLCLQLGGGIQSRSIVFKMKASGSYNNIGGSSTVSAQSNVRNRGYSLVFPAELGIKLSHHEANTIYDVFGMLGASYEMYTTGGYDYEASTVSQGGSGTITYTNTNKLYPDAGRQSNWINAVVGFKIRAVLRRVGLLEYGLEYHYPMSTAGEYRIGAVVSNSTYGSVFNGTFYPRLSHLDVRLCYYFLNINKGEKRYR